LGLILYQTYGPIGMAIAISERKRKKNPIST